MGSARVAADIMTAAPITLNEEDDLWSAQEEMRNLGMHHIPVVDGGKLVGMVTQADLLQAAASSLRRDSIPASMANRDLHETFIATIMHREVPAVRPETPLREAARLLANEELGCVAVTDADRTLRGVITGHDFMELVVELLGG